MKTLLFASLMGGLLFSACTEQETVYRYRRTSTPSRDEPVRTLPGTPQHLSDPGAAGNVEAVSQ